MSPANFQRVISILEERFPDVDIDRIFHCGLEDYEPTDPCVAIQCRTDVLDDTDARNHFQTEIDWLCDRVEIETVFVDTRNRMKIGLFYFKDPKYATLFRLKFA